MTKKRIEMTMTAVVVVVDAVRRVHSMTTLPRLIPSKEKKSAMSTPSPRHDGLGSVQTFYRERSMPCTMVDTLVLSPTIRWTRRRRWNWKAACRMPAVMVMVGVPFPPSVVLLANSSTDRQLVTSLANSSMDRQLVTSLANLSTDRQFVWRTH